MRVARSVRTFLVVVAMFLCFRSFVGLWEVMNHGHKPGAWKQAQADRAPGDLRAAEPDDSAPLSNSSGQIMKTNDTFHRYTTCQNLVRPDPGGVEYRNYWQVYREEKSEIMVYSAFYDDRPAVGLLPSIRLMVVSAVEPRDAEVYCYIWYTDLNHPYIVEADVTKTGRGDVIKRVKYDQVMYTCALPGSHPVPSHVSVSVSPCKPSTMFLPIVHSARTAWEHEFGICVAIAFGKVSVAEFVEWMEFHRLMGVTEFNIYDGDIKDEMKKVFRHYESKGVLRVHKMPPPVDEISYAGVKLSSPASLNDCMLRNMYRYRYMVVIDFDEFVVPKTDINFHDVLKLVDKKHDIKEPWMSYTFRNTYFLTDFSEDTDQPAYAHTLRFRGRARPSRPYYAAKSFIDPRRCFSVFNHYCYKRFPNSDKKFSIDIDPKIAASHHYRKCNKDCDTLKKEETKDDSMLLFKDRLIKNMDPVLEKLK